MRNNLSAFTVVELLVVISVIGVLATFSVVSFGHYQASSRDTQRLSKATILTEALEKYYDQNGEYPSCSAISNPIGSAVAGTVLPGVEQSTLLTPQSAASDTNSIKCQDLSVGGPDVFAYLGDGSTACNTDKACLGYSLKYKDEASGTIKTIVSRRTTLIATAGTTTVTGTPVGFTQINLNWTTVNNALNYTVQRSTNSAFTANLVATTSTAISAPVTGLTPGTAYYFRVMPNAAGSAGNWSASAVVTTGHIAAPLATTTINSASQITLNWNAIPLTQSYSVNLSTASSFTSPVVVTGVTTTSSVFTGLTPGVLYYFRVQALATDDTSDWSTTVSATTAIADNFNRTGATLGTTSTGGIAWNALSGVWSTNGTMATTSSADSSNPVAVVDSTQATVDASVDISAGGGGDALVIRATDSNNYIRARYYHTYGTSTSAGSCTVGSWVYSGQVFTELNSPGTTIPDQKVGGDCIPYDDYPGWNGSGAAQHKVYVTSTQTTCIYGPPTPCYKGNEYYRTVTDNPGSTYYYYYYYVYLEKVVNGVATTLYSVDMGSGINKLRLTASGSTITLYVNGSASAQTSLTETFNQTATKHGIGRGSAGNYSAGSAIDNFSLN